MRKPSKQPRLSCHPGIVPSSIAETEFRRLLCRCHTQHVHHNLISSNVFRESDTSGDNQSSRGSNMILDEEHRGGASRTSLAQEIEALLLDKSKILDRTSDDAFKHLHGWIILQIGSISCHFEETKVLCRCLDHLYSRFEGFPTVLSVQESREALHAVIRTLRTLSSYLEKDDGQSNRPQAMDFEVLFRVARRILGDGTDQEFPLEQLQELILCLVHLSGQKLIHHDVSEFLQMLCSIKCARTGKVAQIALTIISSKASTSSTWRFDFCEEHEKIFYWKCLAEISAAMDSSFHELVKNKSGIEALTEIAVDRINDNSDQRKTRPDFIAMDATDCISRLAKHRPMFEPSRQALLNILLQASCKSVRARAIPGLAACHKEESLWPDHLQFTHDLKSVQRMISLLVEPCLAKSDPLSSSQHHSIAEFAITLLADLLEYLTILQLNHQADSVVSQGVPSLQDIMAICSVLLDCEKWFVVERTITMLGNCLRQAGARLLEECPDLLGTLTTFLICPFSSMTTKKSILLLLNDLARDDSNCHLGMVRQTKVLDGLVAMSSSTSWEGADDHGEHQAVALSLLLLLSESAANRRILAKHTGVLGVLMRAVRDLDQSGTTRLHASLGSREEMKSKIMVIAAAL